MGEKHKIGSRLRHDTSRPLPQGACDAQAGGVMSLPRPALVRSRVDAVLPVYGWEGRLDITRVFSTR